MKLKDTRIETAGVFRCCLETVALEHNGKDIHLGDTSNCRHCGEEFVLTKNKGTRPKWITPEQWAVPVWKPTWQIN